MATMASVPSWTVCVTVFADLWTAHAELATQAGEYANLCDAVDQAIDLLDRPEPSAEEAATTLRAARTHRVPTGPRLGP